jgi:glycolate oxidase
VPELLADIERVAAKYDVRCGTFGHAGDGNLHPTFVWDRGDADAATRAQAACEELYRSAIALGGTLTAEHGIGASRRAFLEEQVGADAVAVMRAIKTALDPLNILNPGKVL